ncbi:hypothetical protein [Falsiroseomonas sp. CW058]|uniref:hypothetical protein n=1 Tax=Falsiroseomonas sp. CW058 TaxID=3388664 RepID=UPI003D314A82
MSIDLADETHPALWLIASVLDHPSVYMGGPSPHSRRNARRIIEALEAEGWALTKMGEAMGATSDTVEIVRQRLADGRTIADIDVHRLVEEIDGLRKALTRVGREAREGMERLAARIHAERDR